MDHALGMQVIQGRGNLGPDVQDVGGGEGV